MFKIVYSFISNSLEWLGITLFHSFYSLSRESQVRVYFLSSSFLVSPTAFRKARGCYILGFFIRCYILFSALHSNFLDISWGQDEQESSPRTTELRWVESHPQKQGRWIRSSQCLSTSYFSLTGWEITWISSLFLSVFTPPSNKSSSSSWQLMKQNLLHPKWAIFPPLKLLPLLNSWPGRGFEVHQVGWVNQLAEVEGRTGFMWLQVRTGIWDRGSILSSAAENFTHLCEGIYKPLYLTFVKEKDNTPLLLQLPLSLEQGPSLAVLAVSSAINWPNLAWEL